MSDRRLILRELLHVFTLSCFAVSQPLYDRLSRHTTYLIDQGATRPAILLLTFVVLTAVPAVLALVEMLAGCCGARWRLRVHAAIVLLLSALLGLLAARHLTEHEALLRAGVSPYIAIAAALTAAAVCACWYLRTTWFPRLVTVASIAIVIFPASFLCLGPVSSLMFPPDPHLERHAEASRPAPVVMIVFDEFCGMSLLNEQHAIDAVRYPNFARLTETSTWFRNATTVHPRTDIAVPCLLTGNMPRGNQAPIESEYPQNLFRVLQQTEQYELVVFETLARLGGADMNREPPAPPSGALALTAEMLPTLAAVYQNTVLPRGLPFVAPPNVPREWFGLRKDPDDFRARRRGLFRHTWDSDRSDQLAHFLECIEGGGQAALYFMHVGLPHYPWCHLPSGTIYDDGALGTGFPFGGYDDWGETWSQDELVVRHSWQRYLLQLGYADHFIGRLRARLEEAGLFDECLLIVTADHGVAFVPGESRRSPMGTNLPDILSVPLFIKLPGQRTASVSDRNVETIDVLPTITDVLDLELSTPVEGVSLLDESVSPRPRKTLVNEDGREIVVEAAFPAKYSSVARMVAAFGSGTGQDRLWRFGPHPELLGRRLDECDIRPAGRTPVELTLGGHSVSPDRPHLVPCCYHGRVLASDGVDLPLTLAIAVNGTIAGITRTSVDEPLRDQWAVLLPETAFEAGENDIAIVIVRDSDGTPVLEPCQVIWPRDS
jgi:hypothetical protein